MKQTDLFIPESNIVVSVKTILGHYHRFCFQSLWAQCFTLTEELIASLKRVIDLKHNYSITAGRLRYYTKRNGHSTP